MLHQVGVLFDLYYDARKHVSKTKIFIAWYTSIRYVLLKTTAAVRNTYVEHTARTHGCLLYCIIVSVHVTSKVRVCAVRISGAHVFSMCFLSATCLRKQIWSTWQREYADSQATLKGRLTVRTVLWRTSLVKSSISWATRSTVPYDPKSQSNLQRTANVKRVMVRSVSLLSSLTTDGARSG